MSTNFTAPVNAVPVIPQQRGSREDLPPELLLGGWWAYRSYVVDVLGRSGLVELEPAIKPPSLRALLAKRREVRRLNRAFRRNWKEFGLAMDACADSPTSQHELQIMWAVRP